MTLALQALDVRTRMQVAFEHLQRQGMFCAHDWTCCNSCGTSALPDSTDYTGFVFYHMQAAQSMEKSAACYLNYGNTEAHARAIVEALQDAGLAVIWNGSIDKKITVTLPCLAAKLSQQNQMPVFGSKTQLAGF